MKEIRILGILIIDRQKEVGKVQELLTKFGCTIRTRLGLHEVSDEICSPSGLILLELYGETAEMDKLENSLLAIEGIKVQKMVFQH